MYSTYSNVHLFFIIIFIRPFLAKLIEQSIF